MRTVKIKKNEILEKDIWNWFSDGKIYNEIK